MNMRAEIDGSLLGHHNSSEFMLTPTLFTRNVRDIGHHRCTDTRTGTLDNNKSAAADSTSLL